MKKFRFYVFGYRDQYFWNKYGPIVRDLMICNELSKVGSIDKIYFFNRPVSIYERILGKKIKRKLNIKNIIFLEKTSFDIIGPLKRRLWVNDCYKTYYSNVELDSNYTNIVLDFLPIGILPNWVNGANYYWYDFIDNFVKHNRYSAKEKELVTYKYEIIKKYKNIIITGVSDNIICNYKDSILLSNGLDERIHYYNVGFKYDFGFMGFITNKFDVEVISKLSSSGYSVAIFGEFYDLSIKDALINIPNVYIHGVFRIEETNKILSMFKVGLVPYKVYMLHDESPLKIYQYLASGKHILSSCGFDIESEQLLVYSEENIIEMAINSLNGVMSEEMAEVYYLNNSWENKIKPILKILGVK